MSQSPVEPNDPRRETDPPTDARIQPPPDAAATPGNAASVQDEFLDPGEPTDDSPTIISRAPRRAERPEDSFASNLRGRTLAHFTLLQPIGVGGMAAVIRAKDNQLDRTVALKILPPEMATDPENIRRFQQEARAAAKLDHENIARVFFCGEDQGLHFIAFEFVEGENLRTLLERRGRIPLTEAINYMLQVATGLAHAATRGVVHRDIKPSNIIISPNGRAKLVDMGLARSLEPRGDGDLTQSGVTLGTFDYISPEQALEPREADTRSDIYSLGCTFYHMLTGQPPVPEGTAARKLHHHQHMLPVDPRQLNPEISDEVAAILARMMAKDPKARYQRPEHLVQHLLMTAQKLGTAAEVPEGVLFVDAPLPGPPRARPLAMGVVAAAVLVALIVALGSLNGPSPSPRDDLPIAGGPSTAPVTKDKPTLPDQPPVKPVNVTPPTPAAPDRVTAATEKDLVDLLQRPVVHIRLANSIDLTHKEGAREPAGLVFHGTDLVIEAADTNPDHRPTIRLGYDVNSEGNQLWAALTVKSGKAILRGLRFEIDAARADVVMAAVAIACGDQVELENCEFVQTGSPEAPESRKQVSVLTTGARRASVVLRECYFKSGQDAVALTGSAWLRASNCAFGPHANLFHLRGSGGASDTVLGLQSCSALLESGSVFRLDDGASCQISAGHCLFSRPESGAPGSVVLIRQTDPPGDVTFEEPQRNGYHNLRAFLLKETGQGEPVLVTALRNFRASANLSVEVIDNPWKSEQPLTLLDKPRQAFQVNEKMAELRQATVKDRVIGVDRCTWGNSYTDRLPPPDPVVRKSNKIVDPTVAETDQGIYPNLGEALVGARTGDVIRIRHTGTLPMTQVRLDEATAEVTIRPYSGHTPVLTLGQERERDAALFRLHDAQLTLEDLQFRLRPRQGQVQAETQAVVKVVGVGLCRFKHCVATLEKADNVKMALVALDDPPEAMKMGVIPQRQQPEIQLEQCLVRGAGDLAVVRVSRPFGLRLEQSLAALSGSLLIVDGHPKDAGAKSAQVSLSHTTAHLGEHLALLRANPEGKGLIRTEFLGTSKCIFATEGNKALVHLDRVNDEKQLKDCFTWTGASHNVYSGFMLMLDQQPNNGEPAVPPYEWARWEAVTKEQDCFSTRVKFAAPPTPDRPPWKARPSDFKLVKPDAAWQDCGVEWERLPKPFGENE